MNRLIHLFLLVLLPAVFSCAELANQQKLASASRDIDKIAVLPVKSDYQDIDLYSINEYFYSAINNNLNNKLIMNKDIVQENFEDLRTKNPDATFNELAVKVSESVNSDYFIYGFLKYYRDREGSDLGVRLPASVVFITYLMNAGSNSVLWSYEYDETQLPLLSDLSRIKKFFKRKGKWITGEDLLKEGIDQTAIELSDYLEVNN